MVWKKKNYAFAILGGIAWIISTITYFEGTKIYHAIANWGVRLSPDNYRFVPRWTKPPFPIYTEFRMFNCTNGDDVIKYGHKPIMVETGPYVFRDYLTKENVTWNDNGTVSYLERSKLIFQPDLSVGTMDDKITNINLPVIATSVRIHDTFPFVHRATSKIMKYFNETIFVTRTVRELLYDGYHSSMMNLTLTWNRRQNIPDKFAWFYKENDTTVGQGYNIFTGVSNHSLRGKLDTFNGLKTIHFWRKECNYINGTTIQVWPSQMKKEPYLNFFLPDVCRSVTFDFQSEDTVHGIKGYKYSPSRKLFASPEENPSNYCFNTSWKPPSGIFCISPCKYGAPIFLSFPHFHLGDKRLPNTVKGIHPNPEIHGSKVIIEPDTGSVLLVDIRIQINVFVRHDPYLSQFENITTAFYPMLWLRKYTIISDEIAGEMKLVTYWLKNITKFAPLFYLIHGTILMSAALFIGSKWQTKVKIAMCRTSMHVYDKVRQHSYPDLCKPEDMIMLDNEDYSE